MDRSHETWPLVSVFHYKDDINPSPEYQRYAVWSRAQQQLLMDSVFRGLDIPKLYLRQTNGAGPFKYEAVDGQQRLRAVWDFFENKYTLSENATPELGGKKYKDLDMDLRKRFDHYQFNLVIIKEAEDAEIREMFCRLQNGKPLNSAEKRNAMKSDMRDFCAELAKHDFFKAVRFGNGRMQHQQVAAQTVSLELEGGPAPCRDKNLQKMYDDYGSFDSTGKHARKLKRIYDFLGRSFPDRTPELKRGHVVSLYLLISALMNSYSLNGREAAIHQFLIDFDYRRRTETDNIEMVKFTERMSHSSDSEDAIRLRHETLLREFHASCPDLIPLDSKRGFDEHQRIAIYRRDGGKCKYCGKDVSWSDYNADHVVPHNDGGPTTVENGWLACGSCNKSKGGKVAVGVK